MPNTEPDVLKIVLTALKMSLRSRYLLLVNASCLAHFCLVNSHFKNARYEDGSHILLSRAPGCSR
jgi:ABC-type tungstate transport system substrate-binding protein